MRHQTRPRPADPYVTKNPFRVRTYKGKHIMSLAEAKERLPVPVFPDRPEWVEMYWRAWEVGWSNLRRPRSVSGFISNFLNTPGGNHVYMWDSALTAQFGIYGRRVFEFMGTLDNFYAKQHGDGFICREINSDSGLDLFHAFDPNSTGPNILAWAEWRYYRVTGDDSRLDEIFWPLLSYHRWLKANRTWPNGLYWATGLSSGMGNQARVPGGAHHHCHWTWVDASMHAALNTLILSQIAALVSEPELAEALASEHVHLLQEINARLWNEQDGFYQDVDHEGRFSPVKSIGAYWALLDKDMVSQERLEILLSHLRQPDAFKRPHRIPSQSADSEGYDSLTGDRWRGGVWSPTNYMVLRGLRAVGHHALAHEISLNHLENIGKVFEHTDTFWEYYVPEKAAPGPPAKPGYVGWTGLAPIAMLFEDVIGLQVDWPQRRVMWDRRYRSSAPYGVRNYPLGPDGTLDLVSDFQSVTVKTTVPFTLTVQAPDLNVQAAVEAGFTEIEL